jgi:hypothetical protein
LTRRRRARPGHALGTRPAVSCGASPPWSSAFMSSTTVRTSSAWPGCLVSWLRAARRLGSLGCEH